jgi:hypothetical protein
MGVYERRGLYNIKYSGSRPIVNPMLSSENIRVHRMNLMQDTLNKILHNNRIKKKQNAPTPFNHRDQLSTPLPKLKENVLNTHDGVVVSGSEFLNDVYVQAVDSSADTFTHEGDALYVLPLCPALLVGTRMTQFADLFQKYKFKHIRVEYVPMVPATQNGMLIMSIYNDSDINPFLYDGESLRMRRLLSTDDAKSFNVFSYCSVGLTIDSQYGAYYTKLGEEPHVEIQGLFILAAGSSFDPPASVEEGAWFTIGQLVLHYEVELFEPNLYMSSALIDRKEWALAGTELVSAMFINYASSSNVFALAASPLETFLGYTLERYHLIIAFPFNEWTANSNPIVVLSPDTPNLTQSLFPRGGLAYLRCNKDSTLMIDVHYSLSFALNDTPEIHLDSALTGTWTVAGGLILYIYDTRMV